MKRATWKDEDRALSVRAEIAQHGRMVWHESRGTLDQGRNKAKRAKRPAKRMTQPKPVRPAHRVRLPIVKRAKVLTHAPRIRRGSTTPMWLKRIRNRRRDALRSAAL